MGTCAVSKGVHICSADGRCHVAHQRLTHAVSVPAALGVCSHLPPQPSVLSTHWIFAGLGAISVILICVSLLQVSFLLCEDSYPSRAPWGDPQKGTGPRVQWSALSALRSSPSCLGSPHIHPRLHPECICSRQPTHLVSSALGETLFSPVVGELAAGNGGRLHGCGPSRYGPNFPLAGGRLPRGKKEKG